MPVLAIPPYATILSSVQNALLANLVITQNGQRIPVDLTPGSGMGALTVSLATNLYALYVQAQTVDGALRLASATGTDLDDLIALLGVVRNPGVAGVVPCKFITLTPPGSPTTIPTGKHVLALDASLTPSISLVTIQDPTPGAAVGQCAVIQTGATSGWGYVQATVVGANGNLAAGQIAQLGDAITGVSSVGNPQVPTPAIPTVTATGTTGSTTYQYQIVGRGLTGTTLPSPTGQTTIGHAAPLSGGNYNALAWPTVTDAVTLDILKFVGGTWQLLKNVAGTTVAYNDTAADTPVAYAYPTANTTNAGYGGIDAESDTALRARTPTALQAAAKGTAAALTAALLAIPGVTRVFLTDAVVGGSPPPGTGYIQYTGTSNPLPPSTIAAIATAVNATKAEGIVITTLSQLTPTPVNVVFTLTGNTGVNVASIDAALATYFGTLALGAPVLYTQVVTAILGIAGPAGAVTVLTLNGNSFVDIAGSPGVLYSLGSVSATIS